MANNHISLKLEILRLTGKNFLEAAIDKLSIITSHYLNSHPEDIDFQEIQRNLVLKSGQLYCFQRNSLLGIIAQEALNTETNKIRDDILKITDDIFSSEDFLVYSETNNLSEAIDSIQITQKRKERKIFFLSNIAYLIFGLILSGLLSVLIVLYMSPNSQSNVQIKYETQRSKVVPFSKTFVFWIPDFSSKEAKQAGTLTPAEIEEKFNKRVVDKFKGFSRWGVNGQYLNGGGTLYSENGWFYQVSLSKDQADLSMNNIIVILDDFFVQESWYIAENNHDTK